MIFSTLTFLAFFVVVFIIYWFVLGAIKDNNKRLKSRILFLILASYYFYMSWNPTFIFLILFSTILDYLLAKKIYQSETRKKKKLFLIISIIANLGFLGYFKYVNFILGTFNQASNAVTDGNGTNFFVNVVLPVGISFYTFQSISYIIDVYNEKTKPAKNFTEFALYIGFFAHLVAGPIVRAIDFLPQLRENKYFKNINFQLAANYILLGLIKKLLIADNISPISDMLFANPEQYGTINTWVGVMAYTIQIYCDFSGYSDMAIGLAALLGYKFPENFNMPYTSTDITEFWRRWHISLSSWLRDYLFIPLGGSRVIKIKYYRNLMVTMLLGGLWHGASWNFVIWGGLHGLALIVHKLYKTNVSSKFSFNKVNSALYNILAWCMTLVFVMVTWVFFRAQSFADAITILQNMFTLKQVLEYNIPINFILLLLLMIIGHFWGKKYFSKLEDHQGHVFSNPYYQGILYGIALLLVILFGSDDNQAFIYFQF